jgi:hypothetical protein
MTWDAIGAVGEILGALAVFCSLIYLAIQIRNQNLESRSASVHQVLGSYKTTISSLLEGEMATIWVKGVNDFDSLTEAERLRFVAYLTTAIKTFEDAYYQWQQGRLEADIWDALLAPLKDVKSTAAFNRFWLMRRHHFRPEFSDYIDALETGKGYEW